MICHKIRQPSVGVLLQRVRNAQLLGWGARTRRSPSSFNPPLPVLGRSVDIQRLALRAPPVAQCLASKPYILRPLAPPARLEFPVRGYMFRGAVQEDFRICGARWPAPSACALNRSLSLCAYNPAALSFTGHVM